MQTMSQRTWSLASARSRAVWYSGAFAEIVDGSERPVTANDVEPSNRQLLPSAAIGFWWSTSRLEEYVAEFAGSFGYITRWAGIYLQGLFLDGERKSIEPLSRASACPAGTAIRSGNSNLSPASIVAQFVRHTR